MNQVFKSAEIRVAAYEQLTPEQGRALYAGYVKRGVEIDRLREALMQIGAFLVAMNAGPKIRKVVDDALDSGQEGDSNGG